MHKKGLRLLLGAAVALCSALSIAGGNLLQPKASGGHDSVYWQGSQIPLQWYLSEDGLPDSGISNTDLATILQTAFASWESVATSQMAFTYMGELSERLSGIDGKSLITFTDNDYVFPDNELAFAITYTFTQETTIDDTNNDLDGNGSPDLPNGLYPAGAIYEADIVFNASHPYTNTGVDATVDIQAVAMHEIGHIIGLSHSIINDTVMFPFLSSDIPSARTLKADDIAYASQLYPDVSYSATYGSVSGFITNGFGGEPILGAHVYAVDPLTGTKIVGAYSLETGDYLIPGLVPGGYYIGIEPLDGVPTAADPRRINEVIKDTLDTYFATEFYDANESNIETSPNNAQAVAVTAGAATSAINIVTNTVDVPGVGITLQAGLNLFAYPVETPVGFTAFDLFNALGDITEINSLDRYNPVLGRYERVYWSDTGEVEGIDFAIQRGEGYLVHMKVLKAVTFEGQQNCPLVDMAKGFNLIGVPCPPAGYSAYDLLQSIGPGVLSVQRYDIDTAVFEIASLDAVGNPVGIDFTIANGVGYAVETLSDKTDVVLPGLQQIFPPFITALSPGRGVIGTQVMILGQGFSEDPVQNVVSFNGVPAAVNFASPSQLVVTVPSNATTGPITVATSGKTSNAMDFVVESLLVNEADLQGKDMINGQSVQGSLDTNSEQDRYTFIATKGSLISATATSVIAGVPDLLLFLEGPSGEMLTSDDNSAGGTNAKINRFLAGRTGRYTLVVTAKPGSGSGAYTLDLDIENTPPVPDIAILEGDHQTGLMGTQLSAPLEVLVTGPNGAPISGVSVSVITNDSDDIIVTSGFTATTYPVLTNSSGIITVNMTLPNTSGVYDIVIDIPGYAPKTIKASSVASLPVEVFIEGNGQDCGGTGCPVDQPLPNPYKLRFVDSGGLPVAGVLTKFTVASGGGKLLPGDVTEISTTSDVAGEVTVTHHLGKKVIDPRTGNRDPQIVAATGTNPGTELWLFESMATAGVAANIKALKTNNIRMTMGTAVLNAIHIKVIDEYENPVPDVVVSVVVGGGLEVLPGYLDGGYLPDMKTNNNGVFVGMLIAGYETTRIVVGIDPETGEEVVIFMGTAGGVAPTHDEFGARVFGASPYNISISVGGVSISHDVDIDMGPVLVTSEIVGESLSVGEAGWVGQVFGRPVLMQVMHLKRLDTCGDEEVVYGNGTSSDGDWQNEPFSVTQIHRFKYADPPYTMEAYRIDGKPDTILLDSPLDDYQIPWPAGNRTRDPFPAETLDFRFYEPEIERTTAIEAFVTAEGVRGDIEVKVNSFNYAPISASYPEGEPLLLVSDDLCFDGSTVNTQGGGIIDPLPGTPSGFAEFYSGGLTNVIPLTMYSPEIKVVVNDQTLTEPNPDPLNLVRSNSGLDVTKLGITLNGSDIFSGTLLLNEYPNFIQANFDGVYVDVLDMSVKDAFSPNQFEFIYYPTASELVFPGANVVDVTGIEDRVGNSMPDFQQPFTLP